MIHGYHVILPMYGFWLPNDPRGSWSEFVRKWELTRFGDGTQTRDFCFIDDVVNANLLALQCPQASGQVVNIGTGESFTIQMLVDTLNQTLGTDLQPAYEDERVGDVRHSRASIKAARDLLNYEPKTSLTAGLPPTVDYYRALRMERAQGTQETRC